MPSSWWRRKWRSAQSEPRNQLLIPMKKRVWWSFGVALAMLGTIGATSYREVLKLRTNDAMVDHTHQVIASLRKVQSLVTDAETGQRGYLITGDEHYLTRYQESLESLDEQFAALRALIADNPEQETNCQALLKLVTTRMVQLRDVLLVREKGTLSRQEPKFCWARGSRRILPFASKSRRWKRSKMACCWREKTGRTAQVSPRAR